MISIFETICNGVLIVCFVVFIANMLYLLACILNADFKSLKIGPVTLTPVIPFPQGNLTIFKGTQEVKNLVPDAKIRVDENTDEEKDGPPSFFLRENSFFVGRIQKINEFMALTFKLYSRLPDEYEVGESNNSYKIKPKISVPDNARTISIKMNGYEHGDKCHDFVPIGGAAPGSHFTYQMFGNNRIQVTRYVVDGKSEIAGFCIYIENPWLLQAEYNWDLLYHLARSIKITENPQLTDRNEINQKKNEVNPEKSSNLISPEWTVKYCSTLRRKVMTSIDSGEVVVHQEWSDKSNYMNIEKCEECTEEGLEKEEQPPAYSSIFIE